MISAVFVSYRSGAQAAEAIRTFREASREVGDTEVIAVVNSGDDAEAGLLRAAADRVILSERNLGFAGGLNRGIDAARGELVLLANPDLLFRPGSIAPLAEAVSRGGLAASGPSFFLDDAERLLLPPFEGPHPFELVRRRLADDPDRTAACFWREVRRGRRAAAEFRHGRTVLARALSGGLVLTTRATLGAVGPFDEGYPLYYEENDWQRRLEVLGGRLWRAAGARVVHGFGQSTRQEPKAAGWFAGSERRYFAAHFGGRGLRALEGLAARLPRGIPEPPPVRSLVIPSKEGVAVAVSTLASFRPFACEWDVPGGEWHPPEAITGAAGAGPWYARAFEPATGRVLAEGRIATDPSL